MTTCPNCGRPITDADVTCPNCHFDLQKYRETFSQTNTKKLILKTKNR
ncbi:zinc-ribbon domain-containing protein [Lactobacillus sp. R2/2]|nr:zinc-ribbon domain-containing protein [Lactobacillus sp. R2/2]